GAGGHGRPRAAHDHARGGGVARAHRLPVPDRARPRDRHRARRHPRHRAARAGAAPREAPLSAITVVGSVAFDTIETPIGRAEEVLGGSATYFAVAASFFAPVSLVAVVGDDFPEAERDYLASHGIDLSGLEVRPGRTFRWSGRYHEDMNVRDTLALELNVFADFRPELSEAHRQSPFVFLANINPELQESVLEQFDDPAVVACDTMNHWIASARASLVARLRRAIVFGSVLASFVVEDFGGQRLRTLTRDDIDRRYRQFVALTEF